MLADEYHHAYPDDRQRDEGWLATLADPGPVSHLDVDGAARRVVIRPGPSTPPARAVQEAIAQILLMEGRLPIHGALLIPGPESPGILFLGDSGHGKSSLVWLALSMGWRVVSDDLIALRLMANGETVGATVRKRLGIAAHLLNTEIRSLGRRVLSERGLQKIRLNPDLLRTGSFAPEARVDRIVFLEHSPSRAIRSISRTEALERLLATSSPALSPSSSKVLFQILSDLARQADAKVARLTQECLSDPRVLEELAS